jgi:protein TonB
MNPSLGRVLSQYSMPFLAVIAGHVFLLWALVKGLAMAAPKPPEVVVMASIISAPVIAPENKAEPAPAKPQPKPQVAKPKQQPLAVAPKKTADKPADRVLAPAPEKVASVPVESPKASSAQVASGAPTKGEVSQVETKATLVGSSSDLAKEYPPLSQRLGEEGTVLLALEVAADGSIADAQVRSSSGYPRLDNAALSAVRKAHFKPATINGTPIASKVRLPIRYELR